MRYLPFIDGIYSTAPGLHILEKADPGHRSIFQLGDDYEDIISNKLRCRQESIHKYYVEKNLYPGTVSVVNRFIVEQLILEHPAFFERMDEYSLMNKRTGVRLSWDRDWLISDGYVNLFDALCAQVPEDMAICQLEEGRDWLAAIHLSAPNHWDPADKVGKPFSAVHGIVPGMEKLNQQYFRMLVSAVEKGPFYRFAWGIGTDARLNHHPMPPKDVDPVYWQGRRIETEGDPIYVRVERQVIKGFPGCQAFLFTIRTYFYTIDELTSDEKQALLSAVESMSSASVEYKGLVGTIGILRQRLSSYS